MSTESAGNNRFWLWILLAVFGTVGLLEVGCSSKTPKYPEDHARFQRVVQAIKTLEKAYVNKDTPALHDLLLPLEQLEILEAEARKDFSLFSAIQLELQINRIIVDGNRISAFVSWQGTWQRSTQEPSDQARGQGVLLWSGNQVILLRGMEGDLPFGMASRLNVPS